MLIIVVIAGYDLSGNTYWEFKDNLTTKRLRRIVKYPPETHYGDVRVPRKLFEDISLDQYSFCFRLSLLMVGLFVYSAMASVATTCSL